MSQGGRSRSMVALSYRPQWAGPCGECPEWPADKLARCSEQVREVLGDRNQVCAPPRSNGILRHERTPAQMCVRRLCICTPRRFMRALKRPRCLKKLTPRAPSSARAGSMRHSASGCRICRTDHRACRRRPRGLTQSAMLKPSTVSGERRSFHSSILPL